MRGELTSEEALAAVAVAMDVERRRGDDREDQANRTINALGRSLK